LSKGLRELRFAIAYDENSAGPADWASRLARSVSALSSGQMRLVPTYGVTDGRTAIAAGNADLFFDTADTLLDAHRGFAFFAGLPGDQGLAPRHLHTWLAMGGGQPLWDDLAADHGLKPLLAAHSGPQSLFLATERVESMAALDGLKVHVAGLARDVARGLGLDPVTLPSGHIAPALQRGEIQAAECGGALLSYALQLSTAARYSAGTRLNRNGTAMFLGVRRAVWNDLGASAQAFLASAANTEFQLSLAEEEAHGRLLYPEPPASLIWPIAHQLEHDIHRVAAAVVAHTAGIDARSRRISDSYAAFRRSLSGDGAYA
jgi:TRAP-type mannitol/chloroaromatic compound transport system substrate-binding protein